MQIAQEHIDSVRAGTDIVEVVGEYVRLKRQGSNFLGLCPFHQEKTPSFNVNPGMGIFKCFGCGVGGDVYKFIMQVENLSFPETVRLLAERAGIVLPESEEDTQRYSEIESIYHALRFAGRHFYEILTNTEEGKAGLDYLLKRGFTEETIKKYGLGYASGSWDGLLLAARKKMIAPEVLEKAGLVIARREKKGYYDRYRGRIMFPIFSHIGKVIGFGGRILSPEEDQPKYINSPETQVYRKSRVLYGLFQGKNAIRKKEEVILVEGYTDVLALHQAGVEYAVASSGTSLTTEQIKLIKRYAKRVLVLYDSDSAGVKAAMRGIELLLKHDITVYGLELPPGEDPDSYIRTHGGPAFEEYVEKEKKDFVAFLHHLAMRRGQVRTPEGQADLTRNIIQMIASMPDPTMHEPFIRRASYVLGVPDIPLFEALRIALKNNKSRNQGTRRVPVGDLSTGRERHAGVSDPGYLGKEPVDVHHSEDDARDREGEETTDLEPLPQEKMLLRIMLDHGTPMVEYIMGNMALNEFTGGVLTRAIQHVLSMYQEGRVDKQPFISGTFGEDIQALVTDVLMQRYEPSENWERRQNISIPRFNEDPHSAAESAMKQLKRRRVEEALNDLKARIFHAQRYGKDVKPLLEERMALLQFQKQIEDPDFLTES